MPTVENIETKYMARKRALAVMLVALIIVLTAGILLCKVYQLLNQPIPLVDSSRSMQPAQTKERSSGVSPTTQLARGLQVPDEETNNQLGRVYTVSGEYSKILSSDNIATRSMFGGVLMFSIDPQEKSKLSRETEEFLPNLTFTNDQEAEKYFGVDRYQFDGEKRSRCIVSGRAVIEISDYTYYVTVDGPGPTSDEARLQKIVSKEEPKITCRP